jgi:hypothetical protein
MVSPVLGGNMPTIVTVYHKSYPDGLRIYQSELQSWLDDGGSLEPLPKPRKRIENKTDKSTDLKT